MWLGGTEVRQVGHRQRKRVFELPLSPAAPELDPAARLQASEGWSRPGSPARLPAAVCWWWMVASPL